jgi:hypothetical protein
LMTALKYPSSFHNILTDRPNRRKSGIPGRQGGTGREDWSDSHRKCVRLRCFDICQRWDAPLC